MSEVGGLSVQIIDSQKAVGSISVYIAAVEQAVGGLSIMIVGYDVSLLGERTFPVRDNKNAWQSQTDKRAFPLEGKQTE